MVERTLYLDRLKRFKDKDLIKVITGIRRCGKSTLLMQFVDYLLKNGISDDQIMTVNLEDLKYAFITDYSALYNYISDHLKPDRKYYVFLDEVQQIASFQKAVDSLYLNKNVDLYITGSNANLLSGELATLLGGRYIEIKMLPLSFKEYHDAYPDLSKDELYRRYISYGSLPYTTQLDDEDDVGIYLSSIYNDIIIKDVMLKNKISDEGMLKSVADFAMDNIGNLLSVNNIANAMKSAGRDINVKTLEKYLEGFTRAYFLYKIPRYDIKGKQYLKTGCKYYVADPGLRYFILGRKVGDYGRVLENVVCLELLARGYGVFVGKADDYEVDFVAINRDGKIYIQVVDTLRGSGIMDRELRSLKRISDNFKKMILTYDNVPKSNEDGIVILNVLDWL